jgi:hypothetical protein
MYENNTPLDVRSVFKGNAPERRTPASEYARVVVREALTTRPRMHLYAGNLSWVVWFVSSFLPLKFIVSWSQYSLDKALTLCSEMDW